MPNIRIHDTASVEILNTPASPASGIAKYFTGDTAGFIASTELVTAFNAPIDTLNPGPFGFGMNFAVPGVFGSSGVSWNLKAGARATVTATQAGKRIPGDEVFGHALTVGDGRTFVAVSFAPSVTLGANTSAGDLQFGFGVGGAIEFRTGRSFAISSGAAPPLKQVLGDLLSSGVIPGNILDLQAMREGDVASVSGSGKISFSASFDLAQVLNPLASPALPLAGAGRLVLKAGASVEIGASVAVSGRYQLRVEKLAQGKVRVGFFKLAASQFQFDVAASAGLSLNAGRHEVFAALLGLMGAPKADVPLLTEAGLSDADISLLRATIEASLSRSIAVSLAASFATSTSKSTMFEYEFDLERLGVDGIGALNLALDSDLSPLTSRASDDLPQGIRMLGSEAEEVRKKKTVWKINLIGIVNALHVRELIRTGNTLFNAETGELVVTDSVSASDIRVVTRPMEADAQKLRKLLMQSLVITAAFRASGSERVSSEFKSSMTYFDQVVNANRKNISDYLDNLAGIGLISAGEKSSFLANQFSGRASVLLDAAFDDGALQAMFLDPQGNPRAEEEYQTIGRDCIARLIQPGDEQDFRRIPMLTANEDSNRLWKQMTDAGPASLSTVLPAGLQSGPALGIVTHDYIVIQWWAEAMRRAGEAVRDMKKFLDNAGQSAEELKDDEEFLEQRRKLSKTLSKVVNRALPDFLDGWGVLAMDESSRRKGSLRGILVTTGPILVKHRPA